MVAAARQSQKTKARTDALLHVSPQYSARHFCCNRRVPAERAFKPAGSQPGSATSQRTLMDLQDEYASLVPRTVSFRQTCYVSLVTSPGTGRRDSTARGSIFNPLTRKQPVPNTRAMEGGP